ncbi:hypothetical protein BIZ37_28650 [Photobacterium sp. BZF1]|uniref:hypothetical protein n=1 Tax=Photobacterium sp. BZF1 TaxID=1904457 RepID=UPI00165351CB|nr:hypothetical protein [Photobacterium sp. BZF1]MBC7006530.1 hypothetical protein [Photobacterium sp. BZF1]
MTTLIMSYRTIPWPLTFMSSTASEIGEQAGKRLVQKMKASEPAVEKVVLAPELIIRGSA